MTSYRIFDQHFQKIPILIGPLIALMASIYTSTYIIPYMYLVPGIYKGLYALILVVCMTIGASYLQRKPKTTLSLILIFLLGILRTTALKDHYESYNFSLKPITIKGIVTDKTQAQTPRYRTCITIRLTEVITEKSHEKNTHTIQIYTSTQNIEVADTVIIKNILLKKPANIDFQRYLMKEKILTTAFETNLEYEITYRPPLSLKRWLAHYKENMVAAFKRKLSPLTFTLFASLFLGLKDKKQIKNIHQQFKQWGILHYLARSGLHLVIIMAIYEMILRFIPMPFLTKNMIILLLGVLYFLLSWPSVSFMRAFLMFIYYKFIAIANHPSHFLHILFMTCFVTLFINPMQLFFLDFQLSFGLTSALGLLNLYRLDEKGPH